MKKIISLLLVLAVFLLNFCFVENAKAGCESQYCACDGQMHPCDFSEEQCKALCGGSEPGYTTAYRNSDLDALYIGFAVAFVAIGVVLYFSGAFDTAQDGSTLLEVSF